MNILRCLMMLSVTMLPLLAWAADFAEGLVFIDTNGNGQHDEGEPGVANIKLSNGRDIVLSDVDGRYRLALRDGDTVFVIKPAGYHFPTNDAGLPVFWSHHYPKGSQALRYGKIAPVDARRSDFALLPDADAGSATLKLLLIADSQVGNAAELEYYRRSIIEPARQHGDIMLGITLGDLVNDALDLYPELNSINAALNIPWLHTPGNHDIDMDAEEDAASTLNYRRHFGPDTVAWEFRGHAFIALNDVIHQPGSTPPYIGGLREDQFRFLENYLVSLPTQTRVVLSIHVPLFDDRGETFRHADRMRLFALLERFREPLILSGHTHTQRHHFHDSDAGWNGAQPLHEYNVGAASGGFWGGLADEDGLPDTRMADGSPNGYAILSFENDSYRTRYYASRERNALRIGLTSPGSLRRGAYPAFPLIANVFGAEPDATVEYRVAEGAWIKMKRVSDPDPQLAALNLADREADRLRSFDRAVMARSTQHLWSANLPTDLAEGKHPLEVRVTSRFEGEFRANSEYQLLNWVE